MRKGFIGYHGGEQVRFGFYWNMTEWEVQIVPREGGVLKGVPSARYMRMPLLLLLVVAPLMGAVYAMFLPFIGIAVFVHHMLGRLGRLFTPASESVGGGSKGTKYGA
jgi:hypothetical protein